MTEARTWDNIYRRIRKYMARHGRDDAFGEGDYWLVFDGTGPRCHSILMGRYHLLRPHVIAGLRTLLHDEPTWTIGVTPDHRLVPKDAPRMGLNVRRDEVIDGLDRRFLPPEFADIRYPDSRPGGEQD
jgi:hypothetical protein